MGTLKPPARKEAGSPVRFGNLVPIGLAMVVVAIALLPRIYFEEDIFAPKLHPKEEEKLLKRLKEIDESEQYALVAIEDGWYPCLHSGRAMFYLKVGEVWKYGVTSKGRYGRYTTDFLIRNNVSYQIQFIGTYSECLKQEQIKLYYYPYLPENLNRPSADQISRPPFNPIMR